MVIKEPVDVLEYANLHMSELTKLAVEDPTTFRYAVYGLLMLEEFLTMAHDSKEVVAAKRENRLDFYADVAFHNFKWQRDWAIDTLEALEKRFIKGSE